MKEFKKLQKDPKTSAKHEVGEEVEKYRISESCTFRTMVSCLVSGDPDLVVRPVMKWHVQRIADNMKERFMGECISKCWSSPAEVANEGTC